MKKYLLTIGVCLMGIAFILSCSKDDDNDSISTLQKEYFSIENANYVAGSLPSATTAAFDSQNISYNDRALAGGMNFIVVNSDTRIKRFFVGAKGVDGYWSYAPATTRAEDGNETYEYEIPIDYSTELDDDLVMFICAEEEDGDITQPYEASITFVSSQSGDLEINLTFHPAKDIDLHLYMPDGTHIYYNNRGGYIQNADGTETRWGLDHDSNAGCSIDGLNNENIVIPAEAVQEGTYKVVVNMYENCDEETGASWRIQTRYRDEIIRPQSGANPASGTYPAGDGHGDHTEVMTFTIGNASAKTRAPQFNWRPIPPTEMDKIKHDAEAYRNGE
ncbi:MAG: hypothetical protein IJP82_05020 [Bacteroidaceae bacterium]|nr:hypothetical protein [Bacteroidaceae bacterium]